MNLRSICIALLLFVMSVAYSSFLAQSDSAAAYKRSFGYGVANLIELYDPINYRPGIYLEFRQNSPIDGWRYNIKLMGRYRFENQNGVRYHELIPFVTTIGLERDIHLDFERLLLSVNANLFYSMSLRKSSIGGGSGFQGDDYGVGISPGVNASFFLRENLALHVGFEYGIGFFREFVSVGTVTRPSMVLKGVAIRNLSFGVRHYF
ncbi:hypothetical protein [Parvicella tangerina]|uniref:Outer membrane protein beta-barrel domain-containing protein n=1 Tax=Parvicella tangerina TaxID=2829795 RepID=A0A916JM39_9FLAO|nr:hypothetical protein [Parvicella tangerina]CAG5078864.1 hypothetical protein CRYO30217_00790 [Parvicella tangerina]